MNWEVLLDHDAEAALEGTAVLEMLPHTNLAKKGSKVAESASPAISGLF